MAKLVKTAMDAPLALEDMQRMIGLCCAQRLWTQVCFYDGFLFSLNKFLASFSEHKAEARLLQHQAAQELHESQRCS
jgi:hypothetical protein